MTARMITRLAACAAALAFACSAQATFHLWRITQLFSNADGTVQFIELTALASGQQFLSGHTLASSQGASTHTYTFTRDLPGDSADMSEGGYYGMGMPMSFHSIVIGTQGFAALGVVTPDYVVPNGFLFTTNGTVNWGGGADVFSYSSLPTDGTMALNRNGTTGINGPKNFNGEMGIVSAAAPLNFQALWRHAPDGTESGWGVNVTHQGDILFATWFTYDSDGSGMWLVMSDGARTAPNTYSGGLFRATGPSFNTPVFNSANVVLTQVGSGTFAFTDVNNGTFTYTVNGITQSKPITREIFSSPVPTCAAGGARGANLNFQDLWWRAPAGSEPGWGVNITHQGDILFATWFTYASNGKGLWLVMSNGNKTATNTYSGAFYQTTGPAFSSAPFDSSAVVLTPVGTGTFTFSDADNGVFSYTLNGVSNSKPITRNVFSSPITVCN